MFRLRIAACLLAWVLPSLLLAFTPGPEYVRRCPHCSGFFSHWTIGSGNSFDAVFWTDGKMWAPHFPERPWLVKCPTCHAFLWIDEPEIVAEISRGQPDERWKTVKQPEALNESDLLSIADTLGSWPEKEKYARRQAWWLRNDPIRNGLLDTVGWTDERRTNVLRLRELLDDKNPLELVLKAEIDRELGDFEGCLQRLRGSTRDVDVRRVLHIRSLAKRKNALVSRIPDSEEKRRTRRYRQPGPSHFEN
jgi:hypothetical protein